MAHQNKVVRLGVIGCGWVTQTWHLPALSMVPGVRVVAVADVEESQATRTAEKFNVPNRYRDICALLDSSAMDAVAICVPPQHHVDVALAAMDRGKAVFIEKPLALSVKDCDRLIERAVNTQVKVMTGFNLRWHRGVRQVRNLIRDGELGRVSLVRSAFTNQVYRSALLPPWRKNRHQGGGVLFDMAIHHFDLWRFMLGGDVHEINVTAQAGLGDDETAIVTAHMTNDVLVSGVFSAGTSESHDLEFYGDGRVRLSCYRADGLQKFGTSGAGRLAAHIQELAALVRGIPRRLVSRWDGGEMLACYRAQWTHFVQCIDDDKPVECDVYDGRRAVEIAVAAMESASARRPVKLPAVQKGT